MSRKPRRPLKRVLFKRKPGAAGLKRRPAEGEMFSTLRRVSKSKQKEKRDTDGPRAEYRRSFRKCQCCRKRRPEHTHEIASGGARHRAVYYRETYLAVCWQCHDEIHRTSEWPISRQLYVKQRDDLAYYDRELINVLRGKATNAITQEEVDAWKS